MSTETAHTYGRECRLAPISHLETDATPDGIPPLKAHFFYSSPIPIDDPLSATAVGAPADPRSSKGAFLRPFSLGDNNALERAWLGLASDRHRSAHAQARRRNHGSGPSLSQANLEKLDNIVQQLALKHSHIHDREGQAVASGLGIASPATRPVSGVALCCPELLIDASAQIRREFCALAWKQDRALDQDNVLQRVVASLEQLRSASETPNEVPTRPRSEEFTTTVEPSTSLSQLRSPNEQQPAAELKAQARISDCAEQEAAGLADGTQIPVAADLARATPIRPPVVDDGISGKPFIRVGADDTPQPSPPASLPKFSASLEDEASSPPTRRNEPRASTAQQQTFTKGPPAEPESSTEESVDVAVGISRLHMVSLPALQMKPIYWSPVNDISVAMRATWFYRDGMVPVEPAVANQLEVGYRELRPWTEVWADELRSALEIGALGEEKASHRLWPEPSGKKTKAQNEPAPAPAISDDPFCAARCFRGEAAAVGALDAVHPNEKSAEPALKTRGYAKSHVIYKDQDSAFLLKPSLKPSAYYGRRPIAKIMKGITVGIPVVRGFDWTTWERLSEKKLSPAAKKHRPVRTSRRSGCAGCQADKDRAQVTDLVLVAHGIGQKFAERVESFHFTHAINAFRRAVNIELQNDVVRSVLREDQRGIMVLPVNWRHILSLEEGSTAEQEDKEAHSPDRFGLKDIEPDTIPAVRSMISDVMFDIPFYMSHHKPKMIAALVGEANRVYRLWCRNNPEFAQHGRVHLIAHSLGSVMAVEILSKQPTNVPRLDLTPQRMPAIDHFEFDTTNLFFLGSPAGFFLLLDRGSLMPRRGRLKPGADPSDAISQDVVGDVGTFGCLAVDNIYNILAREDPIAYLLNGTIDPQYASSLKVAYAPSATTSFLKSVGDAVRGMVGVPAASDTPVAANRPPTYSLPSQLELEVHDFTREDIAEKKAFLLNDNGQIDYYLRSGGGPLEIQYLNMLSAHTSYWLNQDLVRMLCTEIGRQPGRSSTLPAMRAVKATKRQVPRTG